MTNDSEPTRPASQSDFNASGERPVQQLLDLLEVDYDALLVRLTARLRSREAAVEALHDVYVKLRAEPAVGDLRSPRAYLYRMALNLAMNRRRSDWRMVNMDEAGLSEFPDAAPDQESAAIANDEIDRALEALHTLPARRRAIFMAKWRDEKSQAEIASEFNLHKRSVQKELARVEGYLRKILRRSRHMP